MFMLSGVGFRMHRDLDVVYCTSPIEFQISRHTHLPAMVLFAPPTNEEWYLLLAPFCLWQMVPNSHHLPEELETMYLDGKYPVILLRGPFGA
jgi:hypothetical protein